MLLHLTSLMIFDSSHNEMVKFAIFLLTILLIFIIAARKFKIIHAAHIALYLY